jgi:isopentenyldiphosphate isomerase
MPTTDLVLVDHQGKVFMTQRPEDDAYEPGYWHFPGTVLRATDKSNEDALERIGRRELGLEDRSEILSRIVRAQINCEGFNESRRGPEVNRYYTVYLDGHLARFLSGTGVGRFVSYEEFQGLKVLDHHVKINIWLHF